MVHQAAPDHPILVDDAGRRQRTAVEQLPGVLDGTHRQYIMLGRHPFAVPVVVGHHHRSQATGGLVELQVDTVAVDEDIQPGSLLELGVVFLGKPCGRAEQETVGVELTATEISIHCPEVRALPDVDDVHRSGQVAFDLGIGDRPAGQPPGVGC